MLLAGLFIGFVMGAFVGAAMVAWVCLRNLPRSPQEIL